MKKKECHTTLGDNSLRCLNCGEDMPFPTNITLTMAAAMAKAWDKDHASCKPTAKGKARFEYTSPEQWIKSWDTGASSRAIYLFFMSRSASLSPRMTHGGSPDSVPQDPSDFGRCYRLLKAIPEWRVRFSQMAEIPAWRPYVDTWDQLERLYEQELPSGQAPLLYRALQRLREDNQRG